MPIYEYGCQKCGRKHEVVQKMADKPLTRCPSCKGKLTRLLSASALQFKGSGWYVTDYPKKGSGDEKKGSGDEKKDTGDEKKDAGGQKKDGEKAPDKKESGSKPSAPATED